MTQISLAFTNWARGQIDKELSGRFDLPIYNTAVRRLENFFTNFEGNAYFRTGFEDMLGSPFQDCYTWEFKFNNEQNYILLFTALELRFLTYDAGGNFGFVQAGGGGDLVVVTPYTLEESKELQFDQNGDVMVITHPDHAPQDLTRVAADNFTLAPHVFDVDPFSGENPRCCQFYKGRLYFANTPGDPTGVWASEAGDFTVYTVGTNDGDPFKVSLTDVAQPIEWLFGGGNSLIAGTADAPVALNGGRVGDAPTPSTIDSTLTSSDGTNDVIPFQKDGNIFYTGKNGRNNYYFSYDIITETFAGQDANLISYQVTKSKIKKMRNKKDKYDITFFLREDGKLATLNFKEEERIIGWHVQTSAGLIKDIVVITDNEGNPQLFALMLYGSDYYIERMADFVEFSNREDFFTGTDNKAVDQEAFERKTSDELLDCIYLDNALTISNLQVGNTITFDSDSGSGYSSGYSSGFGSGVMFVGSITAASPVFVNGDVGKHIVYKTETGYESGRFKILEFVSDTIVAVEALQMPSQDTYDDWYLTFDTLSGLTRYIGQTIAVVVDGGFFSSFLIDSDTLELPVQVCCAVVGYQYEGAIQSFPLGLQIQAENTQSTPIVMNRVGLRFVDTAGVSFGTDRYRLQPVQELNQGDLNYLPPVLMNGTEFRSYNDTKNTDKEYYIVQDKPLPCTLVAAILETDQTIRY